MNISKPRMFGTTIRLLVARRQKQHRFRNQPQVICPQVHGNLPLPLSTKRRMSIRSTHRSTSRGSFKPNPIHQMMDQTRDELLLQFLQTSNRPMAEVDRPLKMSNLVGP